MAGKKPDFSSVELDEQADAPPPLDFETAYGGLNLPEPIKALIISTGLRFTMTGLSIDQVIDQHDWAKLFDVIQSIKRAYQWIIGDWMAYGFDHGWIKSYDDMAVFTGLMPRTVQDYTTICRNIPPAMRIAKLSFAHFQIIAHLPEDLRQGWIDYAVQAKLSTRQLAAEIHQKTDDTPPLLDKVNKRRIDKVWRNLSRGSTEKIKRDDIRLIRAWLDEVERELKK
jgi:hypothetical protein